MLVLTRKLLEKIYIGDDICVTVVRLEAGQVRLGIEAPREISVVRAELISDREPAAVQPPHQRNPNGVPPEFTHSPCAARGNGNRRRGRSR